MPRNCDEKASQVSQGSKKVPPGTTLLLIREGLFQKANVPGAAAYALENPKKVMVYVMQKDGMSGKPISLKEAIEKHGIKSVEKVLNFARAENHNFLHSSWKIAKL